MELEIRCGCGFGLRTADERTLVRRAQEHARDEHGLEISDELVLAMSEVVFEV